MTNNINMRKVFICAMALLATLSCNNAEMPTSGEGKIAITAATSGLVATRAEGITLTTPTLDQLLLEIVGENFSKQWQSLSQYDSTVERFTAGDYTVSVSYGDAGAEGYNCPAFAATAAAKVLDRDRTTEVNLTATLANAIVAIKTTEAFDNYFPVSEFAVTTTNNRFEIDKSVTDHLFVAAEQSIKIDCSCIRQSNLAAAKYETLATQTIPTTAAATRYVVTYDLTTVGSVTITISLNQTIIDTIEIESELNPNA